MHPQIEKYLRKVENQLGSLPTEKREEELREMESHLEALVQESTARGVSEAEDVKAALSQFGAPRKVGRRLNSVFLRAVPQRLTIAISVVTWLMLAQAFLVLSCIGLDFAIRARGLIITFLWSNILFGILYSAPSVLLALVEIFLAISIRRLNRRSLEATLALMILFTVNGPIQQIVHSVTIGPSWGWPTRLYEISYSASIFAFCSSLVCVSILLANRKEYLAYTGAKMPSRST